MEYSTKRIGDLLVELGFLSDENSLKALKIQKDTDMILGQILIREGFVTEKQIILVLEKQFGIPQVHLNTVEIDPVIPEMITSKMARRYRLIPFRIEDETKLSVAMADPLDLFAIDDLKLATGYDIMPYLASETDIELAIEQYYKKKVAEDAMTEFTHNFDVDDDITQEELEALAKISNAPVVKLVDSIIMQASETNVSDIHIEPDEDSIRIRYRIDGDLTEHMVLNKASLSAIVTRVKIMGLMNIAENRVPQDGRVAVEIEGKILDLRINVMPTVYGEKIVIRLLDRNNQMMKIEQLGMDPFNIKRYMKISKVPNGIILVTGPTGSGKTTTLYATLNILNDIKKNIITVEDPVEYRLSGINQTQVNEKAGLTFAKCLRAILRQDPDIIMIGEIRDAETAQIAVRAAITGHVVLSTLHTNDTSSTIARLINMGAESYLLSSSLTGIVAQRLVKKICDNCKTSYEITEHETKLIGMSHVRLHRGTGCNLCNHTGYKGRTAIYEILPVTRSIRSLIDEGKGTEAIKDQGIKEGMTTLYQSCLELVLSGVTTIDELNKMNNDIENID